MMTSRLADGPGCLVQPGSGDLPAFYCNDNTPLRANPVLKGLHGLVLAGTITPSGEMVATIRTLPAAENDGLVLHSSQTGDDIIALWRGLGRELDVALYLQAPDGALLSAHGGMRGGPYPRRRGSPLSGRRPRFLARRKTPFLPFDLDLDDDTLRNHSES